MNGKQSQPFVFLFFLIAVEPRSYIPHKGDDKGIVFAGIVQCRGNPPPEWEQLVSSIGGLVPSAGRAWVLLPQNTDMRSLRQKGALT